MAHAIDPGRTMSQYVRTRWGAENGFPQGPVYSIAQTSDGYLWIGTEKGLVRFDGLKFQLIDSPASLQPALSHVLGLLADPDGSLWVRLRHPARTLLNYQAPDFVDFIGNWGHPRASVAAIGRSRGNGLLLWILEQEPRALVREGKKLAELAAPKGFSRSPVLSIAQTDSGDIWAGTRDAGLFRLRGGRTEAVIEGLPDPKVDSLVAVGNQLWVGTDSGIVRWDGTKLTKNGIPRALDGVEALAMIVDRDSNLWVGTNSRGLLRLSPRGVASLEEPGSSSNYAITALFEDREGDLWAGSAGGLERLRDSPFVTYSRPEGWPSEGGDPLFVDAGDRIWFAPVEGGLWRAALRGDQRLEHISGSGLDGLDHDVIYSIAGAPGELWVGRRQGGLTHLQYSDGGSTSSHTYTVADGLAQNSVFSVYRARDGAVWAGTLSGGVSLFRNGRFTNFTRGDGMVSNAVNAMLETSDGTMWFATPEGLNSLSKGEWKTWTTSQGLPAAKVNCLWEDSAGVLWAGTAAGLAFRGSGAFREATLGLAPREAVFGLAEDKLGSLWISTANHVLRVNRDKLLRGALAGGDIRQYGAADGLRGVEGVRRNRSVVADPAGRIWFSLNRGISVVDPARLKSNAVPAIAHIENIQADGKTIGLTGPIHIPGGRRRVTFAFTGLSLSVPERVRFRYRLDAFERDWGEPVSAREASYTNLPPGSYRFRLIASNPDGVWSGREESVAFEVDPLFWQTWWFLAASVGACLTAALALYRLRLHQMAGQLNMRFQERLAERTRIAQELHDTLLQGFLSASMQVHVAAEKLPGESEVRPLLGRVLQLMGQVIEEGRHAVRGMRSASNISFDLEQAFSQIQRELEPARDGSDEVNFRVIVEGQPKPLRPLLRDEVYRIGREALLNAFRHAQAASIDVELSYPPAA